MWRQLQIHAEMTGMHAGAQAAAPRQTYQALHVVLVAKSNLSWVSKTTLFWENTEQLTAVIYLYVCFFRGFVLTWGDGGAWGRRFTKELF